MPVAGSSSSTISHAIAAPPSSALSDTQLPTPVAAPTTTPNNATEAPSTEEAPRGRKRARKGSVGSIQIHYNCYLLTSLVIKGKPSSTDCDTKQTSSTCSFAIASKACRQKHFWWEFVHLGRCRLLEKVYRLLPKSRACP
jgi:hypothetical protein